MCFLCYDDHSFYSARTAAILRHSSFTINILVCIVKLVMVITSTEQPAHLSSLDTTFTVRRIQVRAL